MGRLSNEFCNQFFLILIIIVLLSMRSGKSNGQVISHELRRLAMATNQFGIDTLKALDHIEPPDKVIVFCPVCLASSLAMIMMGSSKHQVVSSLRHALYIWSMRPKDINKGFKDIFEFLGVNRQQLLSREDNEDISLLKSSFRSIKSTFNHIGQESKQLPLQTLINIRELNAIQNEGNIEHISQHEYQRFAKGINNSSSPIESSNITTLKDSENRNEFDLSHVNLISDIYIQRGLMMNYQYNTFLRRFYLTVVHPVDFVRKGNETRQHINSIVALNTEGKIKDLIKKDKFLEPRVMMVTAFHFRGTLDVKMKNQSVRLKSISSGQERNDSMKIGKNYIEIKPTLLKHGYDENLDCTIIEIPFSNRLVSLVILMPNHENSTNILLTKLSAQILFDMIGSLVVKKTSLRIPIIKFDRGPINVEGLLKELGLGHIFLGNKFRASETGLNKWMRPADIVHETSIDIGTYNTQHEQTEDRLTVGAHEFALDSNETDHITLDKPFFYFALDSINGLLLTMGRVR